MLYHVRQKGTTKFAVKVMLIVAIVLIAIFLVGCGGSGNCPEQLVGGPSCGDGSGPGPSVLASVEQGVFIGSCSNDTSACTEVLDPVEKTEDSSVYHIKKDEVYTWEVCVVHPKVRGRLIDVDIGFPSANSQGFQQVMLVFDEGNRSSPACFSASFFKGDQGSINTGFQIVEAQGDLSSSNPMSGRIFFQVVP